MLNIKYKGLRALRIINGDRQCDVAAAIGMETKTYWAKETGQSDFTIDEAKRIAKKYGKTLDEIFN